jgi:transcriptional regulator with XRE-family HTH domain
VHRLCSISTLVLSMAAKTKIELYVVNKVREKRKELGMSQADLSHVLEVSTGMVGMAESPKYTTKYSLEQLNKLSKIFRCAPADFLPKQPL